MAKITVYLNQTALPDFTDITETTPPNVSEVLSLDATLNVDFVNYRRSWKLTWNLISFENYTIIKNIWKGQFSSKAFPHLLIPTYGVSAPAYVKMSDSDLKFSGQWVEGFSIEILEQDAIS